MPGQFPASILLPCVELLRLLKVSPYGLPECKVRSALLSTLERAETGHPIISRRRNATKSAPKLWRMR